MTMAIDDEGRLRLRGPHRRRRIRPFELLELGDWRVKLYGIAVDGEPRPELLDATRKLAGEVLAPLGAGAEGLGFAVAHDAADSCFALIAWWSGENELHQRIFSAPLGAPGDLRPHPTPAIGCVWELAVHDFERRAWLEHVLGHAEAPRVGAYLASRFEGEV